MTAIDVTDLPEPDSPTMPSTSPGSSVERHVADGVHDAVVGREVDREVVDLEERRPSGAHPRLLGVEGVPQAVADEVHAQADEEDQQAREPEQPRSGLERRLVLADDEPERRVGRFTPRPR